VINIRRIKRRNCLKPENILKTILGVSTSMPEPVGVTNQTQRCQTVHALKKWMKVLDAGHFSNTFKLGFLKVT